MTNKLLLLSAFIFLTACSTTKTLQKTSFENQRVLFLGNSITQNGLYVSIIEYALKRENPSINYDIISIGLSSETINCHTEADHPFPRPCLKDRLDRALQEIKPDLIIANYGMNDGIYHPPNKERFLAYQKGIKTLIKKVKVLNKKLILLTPTPFEKEMKKGKLLSKEGDDFSYKQPYEAYDEVLHQYGNWLLQQASSFVQVIDLHKALQLEKQERKSQASTKYLTTDGIHPNQEGHFLMARTFLEGVGVESDLKWTTIQADPLFQRVHEKRQDRSKRWLNYIGYTRGKTVRSLSPKHLLVIMAGQSNMVGFGKLADLKDPTLPNNVQFLDFGLRSKLKKATSNFGPEINVAKSMHTAYPDQSFILLKYAVSGASLLDWAPNYSKEKAAITKNARFGNLFSKLFNKIDSLQKEVPLEPIALLWMQGERDARIAEAGKDYSTNFKQFISSFRKQIGHTTLPILAGIVNPPLERYIALPIVQEAQRAIAQADPTLFLINTLDLEKLSDEVHYNSAGQLLLGERYGEQLVKILEDLNK